MQLIANNSLRTKPHTVYVCGHYSPTRTVNKHVIKVQFTQLACSAAAASVVHGLLPWRRSLRTDSSMELQELRPKVLLQKGNTSPRSKTGLSKTR